MPQLKIESMHRRFTDVVETLDYLEIARITITPDGAFACPSEDQGRVAGVSSATRRDFAKFLRQLADRVEKYKPTVKVERRKKR